MSANPIRDVHDAAALSGDVVEASVRPASTTRHELAAMQRDVRRKLRLTSRSHVVELGCGVGLLGVPIARSVSSYLGLDFAPQAVEVANRSLRQAGVGDRAEASCLDVLALDAQDLARLGRFDRVLLYAVFHYARDERESVCFLQLTVDLLEPGGVALVGNIPLEDLDADWRVDLDGPASLIQRVGAEARWILHAGRTPVPLTRAWKLRRALEMRLMRRSHARRAAPPALPANHTVSLSSRVVEQMLLSLAGDFEYHWELPDPAVPLARGRADLIIERR